MRGGKAKANDASTMGKKGGQEFRLHLIYRGVWIEGEWGEHQKDDRPHLKEKWREEDDLQKELSDGSDERAALLKRPERTTLKTGGSKPKGVLKGSGDSQSKE